MIVLQKDYRFHRELARQFQVFRSEYVRALAFGVRVWMIKKPSLEFDSQYPAHGFINHTQRQLARVHQGGNVLSVIPIGHIHIDTGCDTFQRRL